jgi:hypothetical protein
MTDRPRAVFFDEDAALAEAVADTVGERPLFGGAQLAAHFE